MSNVRFDELELMLMAMFEQPTLKDTIVDGSPAACGRGCRDVCACPADHPEDAAVD